MASDGFWAMHRTCASAGEASLTPLSPRHPFILYPNKALTTLPPSTISMGRLPGAMSSLSATMPRHLYTVVARSAGSTGSESGSAAVAFEVELALEGLVDGFDCLA